MVGKFSRGIAAECKLIVTHSADYTYPAHLNRLMIKRWNRVRLITPGKNSAGTGKTVSTHGIYHRLFIKRKQASLGPHDCGGRNKSTGCNCRRSASR